jgi:hypothetical protein
VIYKIAKVEKVIYPWLRLPELRPLLEPSALLQPSIATSPHFWAGRTSLSHSCDSSSLPMAVSTTAARVTATSLQSNQDYWGPKLAPNPKRDQASRRTLRSSGYTVRFWEQDLRGRHADKTYVLLQGRINRRLSEQPTGLNQLRGWQTPLRHLVAPS